MPKLSDHDLKQMDAIWLDAQPESVVREVLARALDDLRVARDRLHQNPGNSSRPWGSMPPWERTQIAQAVTEHLDEAGQVKADARPGKAVVAAEEPAEEEVKASAERDVAVCVPATPAARAGRQPGAIGHGRMQKLLPTQSREKYPTHCGSCQCPLRPDDMARAWSGWDTLELEPLSGCATPAGVLGLRVQVHTRHVLMEQTCACRHSTRAQAARLKSDASWPGVNISEQRLLGPRLAATVVYLCVRMRLPRRKVQELLHELFGLSLSSALIDQTLKQTARARWWAPTAWPCSPA